MEALRTIDLTYVYPEGTCALKDVNFVARRGEFVAVLGHNGSGKTTLFRHFSGALKPTRGRVLVEGREVHGGGSWLYMTVGFVFQDPNDQLFALTVGEDVAFGPRNQGLTAEEVLSRVRRALDVVGLPGYEERPIASLSYGEKRRVAVAGVLAMEPRILVLDEPTAGLDPMGASRMMALLHRLHQQQVTIVLGSHDIDLLPHYVDTVYVLRSGRVVAAGPPSKVFVQSTILYESGLRVPRVAHALKVLGEELGECFAELPISMEGIADERPQGWEADGLSVEDRTSCARTGAFTTGEAAAAAARAAIELLVLGRKTEEVRLRSPWGGELRIPIAEVQTKDGPHAAQAMVYKQGFGLEDPIHGAAICVEIRLTSRHGVVVRAGPGVGRAIQGGPDWARGEAAIGALPRQMIADAISALLPPERGAEVIVSVPRGEEIAAKTINVSAGIAGGIAILGRRSVRKAVLLLGHGSRAPEANEAIYRVADCIRRTGEYSIVEVGFLSLCPPSLAEAIAACVVQGAERIVVLPYFLHLGTHVQEDLPRMLVEAKRKFPTVQIVLAGHLGFHPKLAEIVAERIREAEKCPRSI